MVTNPQAICMISYCIVITYIYNVLRVINLFGLKYIAGCYCQDLVMLVFIYALSVSLIFYSELIRNV